MLALVVNSAKKSTCRDLYGECVLTCLEPYYFRTDVYDEGEERWQQSLVCCTELRKRDQRKSSGLNAGGATRSCEAMLTGS